LLWKRQKKQLDDAVHYKTTFTSESGKIVLSDLIERNGILSTTFNEDPIVHAFNAGKREAILRILTILNIDFDQAEKHLREAKERDNQYQ
jgi:hypothetical protein